MSDYVAMKLTEARLADLRAEAEANRLAARLPRRPSILNRWWEFVTGGSSTNRRSAVRLIPR